MKPFTYLLINVGCLFIPFIASFYPKRAFYKEWRPFFSANILVAILFLVWDYFFTQFAFWGFNPEYLSGLYIANLPIEEILFFICIPYACVFTYFIIKYLVTNNPFLKLQKGISIFLILFLILIGILSFGKWYTALTAFLTAGYLMFMSIRKVDMGYIYLSYFVVLPFFFLSNGLLTGSFLDSPVVWYNNAENLEIRIFTIPVEDMFYGFLLVVMNIDLYEYLRNKYFKKD
ncbi:MAG: lycopene cyclase domain-containing protein [Maribacter sp.]